MARRLRLTGFARFFIIMLFAAPLAYIGASYYNGEDGIANFKKLLGIGKETPTAPATEALPAENPVVTANETDVQKTIEFLRNENLQLMKNLEEKEREIQELKARIEKQEQDGQ